ncbi:MAG: glycerate kinase, partial [Armatimonadetes bacterium]|nr:glycerate kinase [Armatimonadota bacterium]
MRVVVCPDHFKDCLPAAAVAAALARGLQRVLPAATVRELPLADGGEGTVEALVAATGGELLSAAVTGPRGEPVTARYGLLGDGATAVIAMAAASGLELLRPA